MRAIENAAVLITKSSEEKPEPHRPQSDIGKRNDDRSLGLQQVSVLFQNADRPREMLEHIREDDRVELSETRRVLQIRFDDIGNPRARHRHRFGIRLDPYDAIAARLDELRRGRESASNVEYVFPGAIAPQAQKSPIDVFEIRVGS